jgi:predicted DNA-binding ribbon-helix-helix protein
MSVIILSRIDPGVAGNEKASAERPTMAGTSQRAGANGSQTNSAERAYEQTEKSDDGHLKSRVIKRSLVVGGHKTSVSLEDVFWNALRTIAHNRGIHLSQLVGTIDSERQHCNLSSAIRLFVFEQTCNHTDDASHEKDLLREGTDSLLPRQR